MFNFRKAHLSVKTMAKKLILILSALKQVRNPKYYMYYYAAFAFRDAMKQRTNKATPTDDDSPVGQQVESVLLDHADADQLGGGLGLEDGRPRVARRPAAAHHHHRAPLGLRAVHQHVLPRLREHVGKPAGRRHSLTPRNRHARGCVFKLMVCNSSSAPAEKVGPPLVRTNRPMRNAQMINGVDDVNGREKLS